MKVTKFDRKTCRLMHEEMTEALQEIAQKYGVKIERAAGTYDDATWTCKFKVIIEEVAEKVGKADFENFAEMYGADPSWYGKSFKDGRQTMTVTGLNHKASKNRMELTNQNGDKYRTPVGFVKRHLG